MTKTTDEDYIWQAIQRERERQQVLHPGTDDLPDGEDNFAARRTYERLAKLSCERAAREGRLTMRHVLEEEFAEYLAADNEADRRKELVQVAACAVKAIAAMDRRVAKRVAGGGG